MNAINITTTVLEFKSPEEAMEWILSYLKHPFENTVRYTLLSEEGQSIVYQTSYEKAQWEGIPVDFKVKVNGLAAYVGCQHKYCHAGCGHTST